MERFYFGIKAAAAFLCSALCTLLGGWDAALRALVILTCLDTITGMAKAVKLRELSSKKMYSGAFKKLAVYIVVAAAAALDNFIPFGDVTMRSLAIGYYIANEGLSICENLSASGIPMPDFLKKRLMQSGDR